MQNETISQLDRNFEILSAGLAIFLAFMFFYFVSVGVLYFYLALVYPQRNRKAPDQDDSSLKRPERRPKPAENFIEFKKATYQAVFDCPRKHCDTHSLSASTEYASKHREMSRKMGKFVKKGLKVEKDQISKKNSAEKAGNQTENAPKNVQDDQNSKKKLAENSEKDVQVPENPREEPPKNRRFTGMVRNVDDNLSDAPSWNGKEPAALAYFGPGAENGEYESKTITNSSSPNFTMKTARMCSPRQSTATAPSSTLLNTSKLNSLALNQQQEVLKTAQTSSPADPAEPPKVANGNGDQPQTRVPTHPQTGPLKPKMYPILRPL